MKEGWERVFFRVKKKQSDWYKFISPFFPFFLFWLRRISCTMTETGAPPHEAEEEHPSSSAPCVEDDDKRPAKRQARGGGEGDVVDGKSKPSTTTPSIVPVATRLAAVYSVHRPDSSIFKRGGMKREAPAELAATNEKAKRKQRKQQHDEAADAAAAAFAASAAAATATAATEEKEPQEEEGEEDDAATLRRRLAEMRDAWAAPRRGRGLSGAAWVAATVAEEKPPAPPPPPPRAARVAPARSKLAPRMGFHHRGLQYLHPEEAAFLVDRGDLVMAVGVVAAAKREREAGREGEDEQKNGGGGEPAAEAAAVAAEAAARAKPPRPSYPPPPPAALEGDARSARALSVQEAVSLSVR